jgi:hypothetical protein
MKINYTEMNGIPTEKLSPPSELYIKTRLVP